MSEINGKTLSISFSRIIRFAQNAAGCFVKPYGEVFFALGTIGLLMILYTIVRKKVNGR